MFRFTSKNSTKFLSKETVSTGYRGLQYFLHEVKNNFEQRTFEITTDTNAIEDLKKIQPGLTKKQFFSRIYTDNGKNFMLLSRQKEEEVITEVCANAVAKENNIVPKKK